MVGFEFLDTHTETESLLMMDSSPILGGYNNRLCEKRPPPPRNCTYPIPQLGERTFERSRRRSHQAVREGESKSQTGRGNPPASG